MLKNESGEIEKTFGLDEEEGFQLEEYWEVIKRRKNLLIYFSLSVVIGIMVWAFMQTPVFEARGTLMIEKDQRNVLMFADAYALQTGARDEDLITQVKILKSRTLARDVIEDMKLLEQGQPDNKPSFGLGSLLALFKKKQDTSKEVVMSSAVSKFLGILKVEIIQDSRLVDVRYRSANAGLAADVVNTLFDKYIDFNLRMKTESTKLASDFLTTQIEDLRNTLSRKERELQEYGKRKELFYLSGEETTVVEKFADLNKAFTEAQIYRINKEAVYREMKGKSFENYPEVRTNQLVQNLKKEHSSVEVEYKRKAQIFKDSYPEMQRLKSQLASLQQRIDSETRDIGRKALSEAEDEYQSAKKKEDSLAQLLGQQKQDVVATNTNAIYYNSLKIEVTNMRSLLDHLVKKEKESMLSSRLEGLQTSNIKIIDQAEVPISPVFPKKKSIFIMALFLGIGGGLGLIFLLDWLDKTVKTPDQVEKLLKLPSLGFIPAVGSGNPHSYYAYSYYSQYSDKRKKTKDEEKLKEIELSNYVAPESIYAENYRNIRTSILLSTPDQPPRVMAVTSALPQEGKTATVINLAVSFTNLGKKVLVIDGDLRKPRIHSILRTKNTAGLSSLLVGRSAISDVVLMTEIHNLFIIPSGPVPPNPTELLNARVMENLLQEVKEHFDFVFIDSPPLVGIMDPVIIGHHADGVLLVTWGGKTHKRVIEKARDELKKYNIRLLGVVLNKVNMKKSGYGYYAYDSYKYQYGYKAGYKKKKKEEKKGGMKIKIVKSENTAANFLKGKN
jgi:capsular exopolysaccharide synthesis family protein